MNHPSLKSKPLSKETPTIQLAMETNQSHEISLTDLGLRMISIAIAGRVVLIVDGEMLESSFQCFGSHGDSKREDLCNRTKVVYTRRNNYCKSSSTQSKGNDLSKRTERILSAEY